MAPRSIWKGAISFGLVSIPVKTYGAISEHKSTLRMMCPTCNSPLQFKRTCPKCLKEVKWDDIVRGYEVQKGKYVSITPKDLESSRSNLDAWSRSSSSLTLISWTRSTSTQATI